MPHAANLGLITHHADHLGLITCHRKPLCHPVIDLILSTIPTLIPFIVILSTGSFINILKRRSSNCGFKGTLQKNSFNLTLTWYILALHSKRNETKWKSVVCEMEICSLRNGNLLSHCVYSEIPPKKPFRPESSD